MAEDPRLTNILKLVFGGLSTRSPDADPSITAGTMPSGNAAPTQSSPAPNNWNDSRPWGRNDLGIPENMPRNYGVTDDFGKGTATYGPVAGGTPIYGPVSVGSGTAPIIKNAIPPPVPNTPVAPEHTNILKMLFGGGLTRSGVDYGDAAPPSDQPGMVSGGQSGSNQRFFKDPSEAGVALAQAMRPAAHVQTSDISGPLTAPGDVHATGQDYVAPPAGGMGPPQDPNTQFGYDPSTDPNPTFNSPSSGGLLPHIFKPSFRQAATDEAGNIRSASPGLTKGGLLLKIIGGGLQGSLDAMASGALDAPRDGHSPFGAGVAGAMTMPWRDRKSVV